MPKSAGDFVDITIVKEHIALAAQEAARITYNGFIRDATEELEFRAGLLFDSPLEVMFYTWWHVAEPPATSMFYRFRLESQRDVIVGGRQFRVDFNVIPTDRRLSSHPSWKPVVVEVDGYQFHERTREQVTLRDQRDRCLQAAGWKVFHFSFTEFTAHPLACVTEVRDFALTTYFNVIRSGVFSEESLSQEGVPI